LQRNVTVGTTSIQLLGKNPSRSYLLFICVNPIIYIAFGEPATTTHLPLYVQATAFELPTLTFVSVRSKDPNHAFFQEVNAIGDGAARAVYVVEG